MWEHRCDERGGRVDGLRYASVLQVCCDRKEGEVYPWCCCLLYFFVSQILGSVVLGFQEPIIQSFRGMGQQSSRSADGVGFARCVELTAVRYEFYIEVEIFNVFFWWGRK